MIQASFRVWIPDQVGNDGLWTASSTGSIDYLSLYPKIHEIMDAIFLGESLDKIILVFIDAPDKVTGRANIQSLVSLTCQNVDIIAAHISSGFR